jgi:hypothetical protein
VTGGQTNCVENVAFMKGIQISVKKFLLGELKKREHLRGIHIGEKIILK